MSDADEHEFHAEDEANMGDTDQVPEDDAEQDDAGIAEKRRISKDVFDEEEEEEEEGEEEEDEEEEEELSGKKSRKRPKVWTIVFFTQRLDSDKVPSIATNARESVVSLI